MDRALEGRHLLDHPFYRRWERGDLVDGELQSYAEQYRFFETCLPSFLAELADRLPSGVARDAVADNLRDEVSTPSHLEMFDWFARHYGAGRVAVSPAMANLIAVYRSVLMAGNGPALAGLLAYELQGAEIAITKSTGLREHYGATSTATSFWDAHGEIEQDHATWTMAGLESLDVAEDVIEHAAREVADAWWAFLTERDALVGA